LTDPRGAPQPESAVPSVPVTAPITVGLVGAGPWAAKAYAPMLAAGPETRLECVWARRPEAARELAGRHASEPAGSFDELIGRCDAVAFAVPPDVQAEMAVVAARAGRHLWLDKPLALTVDAAERVVDAADRAGVVTQLMLTHRYRPKTVEFLEAARTLRPLGGRFAFLCGAFLDGPYATPWRKQHGALFDLGPHAFDLIEEVLGPIERIRALGDPRRWVSLACEHAGGAISDVSLSGVLRLPQTICRFEVFGVSGSLEFDGVAGAHAEPWSAARRSFAEAVRSGRSSALDARRGLRLQRVIEMANQALDEA